MKYPHGGNAMLARHLRRSVGITALLTLAFVAGCSEDDSPPVVGPTTGAVTVNFDHQIGGLPLQLAVFNYTNAAGNNYSVERLDYYVSDIRLHNANGTSYGVDDVHFRSVTDDNTRDYMMTGVPNGTYNAVSFTFGLDANYNVNNGLPAGTPTAGMGWPDCWGGGYHYMIMEGKYKETGTGTEYGYRTHLGRRKLIQGGPLSCDTAALGGPDAVSYHHFFEVMLPLSSAITVNGDSWSVDAVMDINGWYENPQVDLEAWFPQGTGNIMTDLTAQDELEENGPACFVSRAPVKL